MTASNDCHFLHGISVHLKSDWVFGLSKLPGEYVSDKSRGSAENKASPALRDSGEEIRANKASSSSLILDTVTTILYRDMIQQPQQQFTVHTSQKL